MPVGAAVSVRGAVKTPGLRNVELTAPFFVNGGQATLAQLVDFYSRGGDFPSADVDPNLHSVGFSADDKTAVVAFLKSLTDERVRTQSAPFDHPSLIVPAGSALSLRHPKIGEVLKSSLPTVGALVPSVGTTPARCAAGG